MPYITQERRNKIEATSWPITAGELNYKITREIFKYYEDIEPSYQRINDILGALEGAKMEFYRRIVVPYEDQKIIDNGDVY